MVVGDVTTGSDLVVIGGGPAGYAAAIRATQLDIDVTIVEKDAIGGTCLNRGCIPSKALISATKRGHRAANAQDLGIHADISFDLSEMVGWKDGIVDQLTSGVEQVCRANGVSILEGRAVFDGENRLRIVHGGEGQGSESLQFEHCIIATGSRPTEIPNFPFKSKYILSSEDALSLETVPDELVIIGAGYIGLEMAGVFARLGTAVNVVELLDRPLSGFEPEIADIVYERMTDLGVEFHFGYNASDWVEQEKGVLVRAESEDRNGDGKPGEVLEVAGDKVLVAVGRRPNSGALSLSQTKIETTEDGIIPTDRHSRTSQEHIFAVGDVAGEPMLAHKGIREGIVAAEVIAGEPSALDYSTIPAAVFTEPEIATTGLTTEEATEQGFDAVAGQFQFRANGRALTADDAIGFVRVVADAETGFILGGQIVGPDASELIAEITLAVEMGATLEDLTGVIHSHPTLGEAVMEAAESAQGRGIHTRND